MIYEFGPFQLDIAAFELRKDAAKVELEPQVLSLLGFLVENRERMVSKDEIVEKVWGGRDVTDAAIASRVRSARAAIDDDGKAQRYIRTVHGQGYRFVADARALRSQLLQTFEPDAPATELPSRPSIAVLPFRIVGDPGTHGMLALALPDELIGQLSRLRWLFVTARNSSFRPAASEADPMQVGRLLGVRYCLGGTIEVNGDRLHVGVELVDTRDGRVVWADRMGGKLDDVHAMRAEICARVLVQLEIQIPLHEAERARHAGSENLDAWSAYHLGLQHMYRFNRPDNATAEGLFQRALTLDPNFARAHAGLSFIRFQSGFMRYAADPAAAAREARAHAEAGLALDPLDPFINFTMGRSYWLEADLESSLGWLERATGLCPNYAQGMYAQAWSEALLGRAMESRTRVDLAMRLSPLDPLHYAMQGTRAFTHMAKAEDSEAAAWAERAARAPGAHVLIAQIASAAHTLSGDDERARYWAANVRERSPTLNREGFFQAFPMQQPEMRQRVEQALAQQGF